MRIGTRPLDELLVPHRLMDYDLAGRPRQAGAIRGHVVILGHDHRHLRTWQPTTFNSCSGDRVSTLDKLQRPVRQHHRRFDLTSFALELNTIFILCTGELLLEMKLNELQQDHLPNGTV